MDARTAKALHIAATTALAPDNGRWKVPSQTGTGTYTVAVTADGSWFCSCPDHEATLAPCKHIMAVEITAQREGGSKPMPFSEIVKVTYSQNWTAYNAAQTNEKDMFVRLLSDLCSGIAEPPRTGTGRPPLRRSDLAFALVYRAYVGCSARRFTSDLRTAEADGLIGHMPSFNSLLRYTRRPELEAVLTELIEWSSAPLRQIETDFAVDSSGFGTRTTKTWFSTKHGQMIESRDWRKAHVMCGVRTHIVTAARITGSNANDAPHLLPLAASTAERFDVDEISADKGYLTKRNAAGIEALGASPFIPFKSNSVEPPAGTAWARMYHLFAYNRDEFAKHYHKRSNVETVFHMIKAKFGDTLFGKTDEAQTNEVLAKLVAHNLCVLIQSFYELGVDPVFGEPRSAQVAC
ncbi:MAG: transposase [Pseudonocardia sp.]|nr:transposase [Pseudonocardia sp.]